mmetsp:Transcript_376/g.1364  ORF Transcript_376/g.1364 Transcript_376/m.1364 type:complete len:93 (-) Transcript_376:576-854(-)
MTHLKHAGKRFGIISYEQFLEGGSEYLQKILNLANVTIKCTDGIVSQKVHKVHSDRLSDTVTNYDQILRYFTYKRYPTWGDIARDFTNEHIA